jgi:hypothetical protein
MFEIFTPKKQQKPPTGGGSKQPQSAERKAE